MRKTSALLLGLTFLGFISLGLPDALSGVLWPSASKSFGLPLGDLGFQLFAFTSGYLISTLSIARLLQKVGVGGLLAGSCALVTISLAGFALAPWFPLYLAAAVVAGLGAGAIDTGLNAFAARHFSAKHMSWLHACWGVGASSGAAIAAYVIAQGSGWQWGYGTVAIIMLPVTVLFFKVRHVWNAPTDVVAGDVRATALPPAKMWETLQHPLALVQAAIFFVYVGAEAILGQWGYTVLTQHRGLDPATAGFAVSAYWTSLTVGRFILGPIIDRIGLKKLLSIAATTAIAGGVLFATAPTTLIAVFGMILLGVSLAPIYPCMMSQTPDRMDRLSDSTIGLQAAASMMGAVLVPTTAGAMIAHWGLGWISVLPAVLLTVLWVMIFGLFWSPNARVTRAQI